MRKIFVAAVIVVDVGIVTLASGENKQSVTTTDQWMKCYDLGWSRGVHLELGEMPGWINECLAGNIPGGPEPSKTKRSNILPHWQ
jgi:hypothetical protein